MISSAKEKELTLESQSTAYELSDFFDGFEKMTAQMMVNITRNLIKESMNEIARGNSIVEGVVGSIQTSVEAIESVNGMIQKTSDNAVSQAMNMERIRAGIEEISMGIQESSATSEELAAQATTLNEMVQRFEM